jgi:hypothetical protein
VEAALQHAIVITSTAPITVFAFLESFRLPARIAVLVAVIRCRRRDFLRLPSICANAFLIVAATVLAPTSGFQRVAFST